MEKKKIYPDRIQIKEFRLVNGNITSPYDFDKENIKSFDFKVEYSVGFNLDEKLIKADLHIKVATVSQETVTEEATGKYYFVFIFQYDELAEHTNKLEDEKVDVNPYLSNAIAAISYSTSRGILLSRFQGTVMQDFLLPIIDPNTLFQPPDQQDQTLK